MEKIINRINDKYRISKEANCELRKRLEFIKIRGYNLLIENLKTNRNNLLAFITELNVIYEMINELEDKEIKFNLEYEVDTKVGSPDIKLKIEEKVFWIQIKWFSKSKIDNMDKNAIEKLKNELSEIPMNYKYRIIHSNDLTFKDVKEFMNKFRENYQNHISQDYPFRYDLLSGGYIELKFNKSNNLASKRLKWSSTIGEFRENKNEVNEQICNSLKKALKSVEVTQENSYNIIFAQTREFENKDFGNVFYGQEKYMTNDNMNSIDWMRKSDGLIEEEKLRNKMSYYVVLDNRQDLVNSLLGNYKKSLFCFGCENPEYITKYLNFEHIYSKESRIT